MITGNCVVYLLVYFIKETHLIQLIFLLPKSWKITIVYCVYKRNVHKHSYPSYWKHMFLSINMPLTSCLIQREVTIILCYLLSAVLNQKYRKTKPSNKWFWKCIPRKGNVIEYVKHFSLVSKTQGAALGGVRRIG